MRSCRRINCFVAVLTAACSVLLSGLAAHALGDFDTGMKLFKGKRYAEAARYFERASNTTPWESSPLYYCALSYHYAGDFKHAIEKYDGLVNKFPGTAAYNNAVAALKVVDPTYFQRKEKEKALETAAVHAAARAAAGASPSAAAGTSRSADKGTVEGDPQTRVYFTKQGDDKLVDVRVGGRSIRVKLDEHAEDTAFSKGQLSALGIQATGKEVRADVQVGGVVRKNFPIIVDDAVGANPRLGNSFLSAFSFDIDNAANFIDLRRKQQGGNTAVSSGNSLAFRKEGKDILVNVDVNGRPVVMQFEPNGGGGVLMSAKSAKAAGLRVEDAEETVKPASELPQRGEPGWVAPDERTSGPKYLYVQRMKLGPVDRSNVQVQVSDKDSRYPKIGSDFVSGGWKFDIDYENNLIRFRH